MTKQGSIRQDSKSGRYLIGRRAFAKISAVEGIRISADLQSDFAGFDKLKASPSERRTSLTGKYGSKKK